MEMHPAFIQHLSEPQPAKTGLRNPSKAPLAQPQRDGLAKPTVKKEGQHDA